MAETNPPNTKEQQTMKLAKKMTQQVFFQVTQELLSMKTDLEAGKYTYKNLAGLLSKKFGTQITEANVAKVLKITGIKTPRASTSVLRERSRSAALERIEALENRVAALEELLTG